MNTIKLKNIIKGIVMPKVVILSALYLTSFFAVADSQPIIHNLDGTRVTNFSIANVNFNGNIVTATCAIQPEDQNKLVNLGTRSASLIMANRSAGTPFSIKLIECNDLKTAYVTVMGAADPDSENQLFRLTGNTGAALELKTWWGEPKLLAPMEESERGFPLSLFEVNELPFMATLRNPVDGRKITPGTVRAETVFYIRYY